MKDWSRIIEQVKPLAYDMYRRQCQREPDQVKWGIILKHLWYTCTGDFGIEDTKSDYAQFKNRVVRARERDPEFDRIFKDEDRYRSFEYDAVWTSQKAKVILMTEKNAMKDELTPFVRYFGTATVITRGSISRTVLKEVMEHMYEGTVVVYLGDFNPKGAEIREQLTEKLGNVIPLALTEEQVKRYKLPRAVVKGKGTSKKWIEHWERNRLPTAEVDALATRHPAEFEEIVRNAILEHIDKTLWVDEKLRAKSDSEAWDIAFKLGISIEDMELVKRMRELTAKIDGLVNDAEWELRGIIVPMIYNSIADGTRKKGIGALEAMKRIELEYPYRISQEAKEKVDRRAGEIKKQIEDELRDVIS